MTVEEVKASRLRGKMRALQEECCCARVENPGGMLAVVALAAQSLHLERQMKNWKQVLVRAERKPQVAS